MMGLFRAVRVMLWLPFKIMTLTPLITLGVIFLVYKAPLMLMFILLAAATVVAIGRVMEPILRPKQRVAMPGRGKPLVAALVRMSQKLKYRSPGRSAFTRSLSPQLKQLLRQPANQKPAAVRFEEEKIAGYRAEGTS